MTGTRTIVQEHLDRGTAPGIVVAHGNADGDLDIVAAGDLAEDSIVRIQSMTKAITTVAALRLVQQGRLRLDDPVQNWLPELADRRVLRTPTSALSETVPADRPITVRHLLTNTAGYGGILTPSPLAEAMAANRTEAGVEPVSLGSTEWLNALAELPLAFQPGTGWRYHQSFGVLGILLSRLTGGPLQDHLTADVLAPLGMVDTAFVVPAAKAHRLSAAWDRDEDSAAVPVEPAGAGFYVAPAPFDLSHAELVSTARDYSAFARMLAAGGKHAGEVFVAPELIERMRTDQVPASVKTPESFFPGFWSGLGWGLGVSVHLAGPHTGRYGWSGGQGTDFHVDPDGSYRIVLTQMRLDEQVEQLLADLP